MKLRRIFRSIILACITLIVVFAPAAPASAILDYDTLKIFANNDIIYYNPSSIIQCSEVVDVGDNLYTLMAFFMNLGYSQQAAAAILGNLKAESGLNQRIYEGTKIADDDFVAFANGEKTYKHGFGLAQWTHVDRVQGLQEFADSKNLPVVSISVQAEYIIHEFAQTTSYHYSVEEANSRSLEENVWVLVKTYEAPSAVIHDMNTEGDKVDNKFVPSTLEDLDPENTAAAYNSYHKRLSYAQEALAITVDTTATFKSAKCTGSVWSGEGFPSYSQCDSRWKSLRYGRGGIYGNVGATICSAGCGPTSFAMLVSALLGREILPPEVVDIAGRAGMYVTGKGSSHSITKYLADYYGLQYEKLEPSSKQEAIEMVSAYLRDGWLIHSSGGGYYGTGAAPYSVGGHYIGIRGVTSDGKWLIANTGGAKSDQTKEWDPNEVVAAGMNIHNLRAIKAR